MTERPDPGKIADAIEEGAREAFAGVRRGIVRADAALTPGGADLAPLLGATDLPELPGTGEGALGSLGLRLDREADLERGIALRELGRVAWLDRVTLIVVLFAFLGEGGIAACATASTLVGASEGRGALFALAAVILAGGAGGFAAIVAGSRRVHRELAAEAQARARSIEAEIFRVGLAMEWRSAGATLFQDALARLEGNRHARDEISSG